MAPWLYWADCAQVKGAGRVSTMFWVVVMVILSIDVPGVRDRGGIALAR